MTYDEYRALRKTIATPFGDFAYLDVGEGPAAVFVHGLFMSAYMWHRSIDAVKDENPMRAMLVQGYAGWGPGQLEMELRQGVWIPVDLDARVLFNTTTDKRWSAALAVLGIHPASLPRTQIAQA